MRVLVGLALDAPALAANGRARTEPNGFAWLEILRWSEADGGFVIVRSNEHRETLAVRFGPGSRDASAALSDEDSAVRYWAALGLLMRGAAGVAAGEPAFEKLLDDPEPAPRIVAGPSGDHRAPPARTPKRASVFE
jgi:hypothetical protein